MSIHVALMLEVMLTPCLLAEVTRRGFPFLPGEAPISSGQFGRLGSEYSSVRSSSHSSQPQLRRWGAMAPDAIPFSFLCGVLLWLLRKLVRHRGGLAFLITAPQACRPQGPRSLKNRTGTTGQDSSLKRELVHPVSPLDMSSAVLDSLSTTTNCMQINAFPRAQGV